MLRWLPRSNGLLSNVQTTPHSTHMELTEPGIHRGPSHGSGSHVRVLALQCASAGAGCIPGRLAMQMRTCAWR